MSVKSLSFARVGPVHFQPIELELRPVGSFIAGETLNAGCGYRDISSILKEMGASGVVNVDIATDIPGAIESSLDKIPLEADRFDTVLCNAVLEHVEHIDAVMAELVRVLKPGGRLIVSIPFLQPYHASPTDFRRFTVEGIRQLGETRGLEVVQVRAVHSIAQDARLDPVGASGRNPRPRGGSPALSGDLAGDPVLPCRQPERAPPPRGEHVPGRLPEAASAAMRVIFSTPDWTISGVNSFNHNLMRGLQAAGHEVELLVIPNAVPSAESLPLPTDVPTRVLEFDRSHGFYTGRWTRSSGISTVRSRASICRATISPIPAWRPCLDREVGIVGVVHSDDPYHYEHLIRLGRYWNATVAVSSFIMRRMIEIEPIVAPTSHLISYGVPCPPELPVREAADGPLRIVYSGRFYEPQKRVSDLARIALALARRGVPADWTLIGSGADEPALRAAFAALPRRAAPFSPARSAPMRCWAIISATTASS